MADHVREPPGLAIPLGDGMEQALAPAAYGAAPGTKLTRSGVAWALYEGGRTPYVLLCTIYVFMPYFATVMVGNAVEGQALVARITTIYGLCVAVTAPFLGAMVDRLGPRKPLLAVATAGMAALIFGLWWARPDHSGLSVTTVAVMVGAIGILFSYTEVLHNALLPHAVPPNLTSNASGLGLALGNGMSVILLVTVLWCFALPGRLHLPGLPGAPMFGLSTALHEPDRIVAPIQAVVFAVLALPLFLFTRDAPKGLGGGASASVAALWTTLKGLRRERDMATFLASRMLYTDGMTAILIFSGVYAAGVMGWKTLDLLALGILMSFAAAIGGLLASALDRRFGPKRAIQIEITTVIVCEILILGLAPDRIFYMPYTSPGPLWSGPVFRTVPELLFLGLGCINALGVCGSYASSRVLLTKLTTPERVGSYFGLYGLSGNVTLWVGSLLITLATALLHTQQAGFIPIAGLLLIGLVGLSFVDPARAARRLSLAA